MKFNGATFNKAQQDQLKKKVGAELNEVYSRMLNYTGDWASGNEYHENDVVTWPHDGHLYEVIKAHTSSSTIDPSNTEYYKAMTASKAFKKSFLLYQTPSINSIKDIVKKATNAGLICFIKFGTLQDTVAYGVLTISPDGNNLQAQTSYLKSTGELAEVIFIINGDNAALYQRSTNIETGSTSFKQLGTGSSGATIIIGL